MHSKSRSLLILLIALVLLGAIYFLWQNPLTQRSNQAGTEQLLTGNLDNLQKIEITKNSQTTTLEKQSDKWVVASQNNAEANSSLIDKALTTESPTPCSPPEYL